MIHRNLLFLTIIILIMTSCKKDDEEDSTPAQPYPIPQELIGLWKYDVPYGGAGAQQYYKRTYTKTTESEGRYEFYWIADIPDWGWQVIAAEKGDYTVDPVTVFMTPTEFGSEQKVPGILDFYDTIQWYFPGDSTFDMFGYYPESGFEVDIDTLHLKFDENENGTYEDDEILKFLRENK